MLPNKVLLSPYSAVANERALTSGLVHAIHVAVEGIEAGGANVREEAARTILKGMELEVTRTFSNGKSVSIIDTCTVDFLRRKSNHQGGYNTALQGALIPLGPHDLDTSDDSELVVGYDREDVREAEFSESIDVSNAKIRIRRVQALEAVPPALWQYLGKKITRTPQTVPMELRGSLHAIFYEGDSLSGHKVTINGNPREIPASFTEAVSAGSYRHEQTDAAPLMQLFEADAAFANKVSPEVEVDAEGGRVVQVGTFSN